MSFILALRSLNNYMCQDKKFLISQEKKKIGSLQSQLNLKKMSWTAYFTVALVFQMH